MNVIRTEFRTCCRHMVSDNSGGKAANLEHGSGVQA
jgi:hypothetical protein